MARVVYGNLEHSVPQRVLMVGLGGGSIAATLMQWHKLLRIDALESSRKTVSAYENHFVPAYRKMVSTPDGFVYCIVMFLSGTTGLTWQSKMVRDMSSDTQASLLTYLTAILVNGRRAGE
jgi:hypothetical protein